MFFAIAMPRADAASVTDFTDDLLHTDTHTQSHGAQDSVLANIRDGEYRSAWDEFGTSPIVDGTVSAPEVTRQISTDIASDVERQVGFYEQEMRSLSDQHLTPEEAQEIEGTGSNDLLPEDYIEPHPSLDANPDVNFFAPNDLNIKDHAILSEKVASSDIAEATDTQTSFVFPLKPADIKIFQSVLGGEGTTSSADVPVSTPPSSDVPAQIDIPELSNDSPAEAP